MAKVSRDTSSIERSLSAHLKEIGGYAITQIPGGVSFALTGQKIILVILYRLLLLSLGQIIITNLMALQKIDGFFYLIMLLCVVPVVFLVLAPIRLGYEIGADGLKVRQFLICFVRKKNLPIAEITGITHDSFRGSKSMFTAVTTNFQTKTGKIKAARFYASTNEKAAAMAADVENIVNPLLRR